MVIYLIRLDAIDFNDINTNNNYSNNKNNIVRCKQYFIPQYLTSLMKQNVDALFVQIFE